MDINYIRPQEGYQMKFLSTPADIAIGGGAAGVGKTWSLLIECMRNIPVPNYGAVVFRRTSPMIKGEGGLWDASGNLFSLLDGAVATESKAQWSFLASDKVTRNKIKFSHLQYESDLKNWQGTEIPLICFDELTHFSKKQFFYMVSRNRTMAKMRPYMRATCNPDPDSWVREFIDWFIGPDGYPIPDRQGVLRYFMIHDNNYIWGSTKEEVVSKAGDALGDMVQEALDKGVDLKINNFIKSMTFIGGSIYDNKELLSNNPEYLGSLNSQDEETKVRLLGGNWNQKISKSDIYGYNAFKDIFTNHHVADKARLSTRCITADIALKGSDKFVVFVWYGRMLVDFLVMSKSLGNEVVGGIKKMALKHQVRYSNIIFDNDGVGGFVDGFVVGAKEFKNGSTPVNKEKYRNLKTQCFYKSGKNVDLGLYYIPEDVANRMYDDKKTLKERLIFERKAIKQDKEDDEKVLHVIGKDQMKIFLNGESPDLMDAFMMREYLDLKPKKASVSYEL